MQSNFSVDELRLVSILRAIKKFNQPHILGTEEASVVAAYINGLVDMNALEEIANADNLEWYLDGIVLGLAASRLLSASVEPDDLPRSQLERARQFQTGVDADSGEVNING